ncbi:MAG: 5-formyltetrahydrofolate cyclo-ligase [Alphaproteobacteria bacterium RIFCSPHIGHO2_01_FULL_40_8]|nr:MAG: 5-formyltetrahydrofolate cyclo-ligase [Alphaproteobacteria bacterium RIFCSPHIGHO2_01_FULL_40_8]
MTKSELRKIFKDERAALTYDEVQSKSAAVGRNFIQKIFPQNRDKIFAVYIPSRNEVDTKELIEFFRKNHVRFCYPKIIAKNSALGFVLAEKNQKFAPNIFFPKIIEPILGQKVIPDFIILPLLAFDRNLNRLGMGGGFFDRTIEFLQKQKPEIKTIGLAYEFQRADENLPHEKTDKTLDVIITEKSIFLRS